MAERFGGKYSPGSGGAPTPPGGPNPAARPKAPAVRATGTARVNLLYLAPLPLLWTAFRQDATGMALDLVAAAILVGGIYTLSEGIKAEAAFNARAVARRPALPRKILAAVLCGVGAALAAFAPGSGAVQPVIYGVIAGALHIAAFGIDPLKSKGISGADSYQSERVARAIDTAEGHLKAMSAAIARSGDRPLQRRVEEFAATARLMFRKVEEDPRDLTAARKYLGVYLEGARDATIKFADLYVRNHDKQARADYAALLEDLDTNFAARTDRLMEDDRTDLDIEIEVLRERLTRDGVRHPAP